MSRVPLDLDFFLAAIGVAQADGEVVPEQGEDVLGQRPLETACFHGVARFVYELLGGQLLRDLADGSVHCGLGMNNKNDGKMVRLHCNKGRGTFWRGP